MQREIQPTADGSHTIAVPGLGVTYHSKHGAIAESLHVFIEAGLNHIIHTLSPAPLNILEIGFGTGLNALLTWQVANNTATRVQYTGIELFPLLPPEISTINHGRLLLMEDAFQQLHQCPWEQDIILNDFFTLHKINISLLNFTSSRLFHCIYFDAFAPDTQPELWTRAVFEKLYAVLYPGGCLLTYSSKSIIRHAMSDAGFTVTKIPGPFGKREMVRAVKEL